MLRTNRLLFLLMATWLAHGQSLAATPVDDLPDLTGRATAVVTLKAHDNFSNEFTFDVQVRNHMATEIEADSLVLVLDHVRDLAAKDALGQVEAVGQDGETSDGKPYFKVSGPDLPPYGQSGTVTIRLRNPDYAALWTPAFRIRGTAKPASAEKVEGTLHQLVEILIKKGLLTEEEWSQAVHPERPAEPGR